MSRHAKSSTASAKQSENRGTSSENPNAPAVDSRSPEVKRAERIRTAGYRETVEAFVVAFILALLFRAFIAEAFVIPTGSMAPTLMGAHKDIDCDRCGKRFPIGASLERRGPETEQAVVGGICPNCRHVNMLDLVNDPNHTTFSGDRILVSKFAYTLHDPERWDVIVFKFPGNPKQNYIKRLVGLPNEILTIRHGDVYTRPHDADGGPETESPGDSQAPGEAETLANSGVLPTIDPNNRITRKPPETLLAMRHLVNDTSHQAAALIEANYPSRWQPWAVGATEPPTESWQVDRDEDGLTARLKTAGSSPQWLRYFHRWPSAQQWQKADQGLSLASVDPYASRLITDFYAYDSYIYVDADRIYDQKPSQLNGSRFQRMLGSGYSGGVFRPSYESGGNLDQFNGRIGFGSQDAGKDGLHWVGDLIVETDVETSPDSKQLVLELVEAGVRYQCRVDLANGVASLAILDGDDALAFDPHGDQANTSPTAETPLTAGSRHRIRFSNCDDQLLLWVDDSLVSFGTPTSFDARQFRTVSQNYPHYNGPTHPLDAAPVGVAVAGGEATIRQLRIDRDKYYIATRHSSGGVFDYDMQQLWNSGDSISLTQIQQMMTAREDWDELPIWDARRSVNYTLAEDQFFPMGDNSPESLDARCWAGTKEDFGINRSVDEAAYRWANASYVPRDLLVGKALAIFWPHPWRTPLPFTPNFQRMRLIR